MQTLITSDGRIASSGFSATMVTARKGNLNVGGHPKTRRVQFGIRLERVFQNTNFDKMALISAETFQKKTDALVQDLEKIGGTALFTSGAYPIALPRQYIENYSKELFGSLLPNLANCFLSSLKTSVCAHDFTPQQVADACKTEHFSCVGRHHELLTALSSEDQYAIFFPIALQGFSIQAARDALEKLPPRFSLAGPIETAVAHMTYPDFLNTNPPRPNILACGVEWVTNSTQTVMFGTSTSKNEGQQDITCSYHLTYGLSPPHLYQQGHPDFSPGLLFR